MEQAGLCNDHWGNGQQSDAQEFLRSLLDMLHAELDRSQRPATFKSLSGKGSESQQVRMAPLALTCQQTGCTAKPGVMAGGLHQGGGGSPGIRRRDYKSIGKLPFGCSESRGAAMHGNLPGCPFCTGFKVHSCAHQALHVTAGVFCTSLADTACH